MAPIWLLLAALAGIALHAQAVPNDRDLNRRGDGVNRLQIWFDAAQAHRPGVRDDATQRIATWTVEDLEELTIDLPSLLKLMDDPRGGVFSVWIESGRYAGRRRVLYSGSELERLRAMARAAGGRSPQPVPTADEDARIVAAQNRLLKRGAAMHTTLALGRSDQTAPSANNAVTTRWEGLVQFKDGRQTGIDARPNHWKFARGLLALVTPSPSRDPDVRDWYRASSAALLYNFQLHFDHMDEAARLFPDDPLLLTLNGSFHESLASTRVQAFTRSAVLPRGVTLRVGPPKTELERAEALFRRALTIDPRAAEARVRLGHVLSLQARHADALGELRQLDASAPRLLQYYGALFAGGAAEALRRVDEARAAYERAATLYPKAQAPRLALSHLTLSAGDATRAVDALEHVLTSSSEPEPGDDPFWTYHTASGHDANALLEQAYRVLTASTP